MQDSRGCINMKRQPAETKQMFWLSLKKYVDGKKDKNGNKLAEVRHDSVSAVIQHSRSFCCESLFDSSLPHVR